MNKQYLTTYSKVAGINFFLKTFPCRTFLLHWAGMLSELICDFGSNE